ncbi:MAG TPA: hypothetical protein VJP60_02400 [Rhizomicrobium sp.]|nr:hypothetical protein [Rhizomicrobium sp.]
MIILGARAERFAASFVFTPEPEGKMRACFLGQNICGLGFGVATLRTPPLVMDQPVPESPPGSPEETLTVWTVDQNVSLRDVPLPVLPPFAGTQAVANSPRLAP